MKKILLFLLLTFSFLGCQDSFYIQYNELPSFEISGKIFIDGQPVPNVDVYLYSNTCVKTDVDGFYQLYVYLGEDASITPKLGNYTFNPPNREYDNVSSKYLNQDFELVLK
jgi:hypothetical protein